MIPAAPPAAVRAAAGLPSPTAAAACGRTLSAARPTQGDSSATTACGTTMQAAMIKLAKSPARMVTAAPANGSIAAFDRWNSSTQTAKISSRRSASSRFRPGISMMRLVVCARAWGPAPIAHSAASAGTHKAAVNKNTNRDEKYAPVAPITAAARPLPIEA